jgi:hypothetical protein
VDVTRGMTVQLKQIRLDGRQREFPRMIIVFLKNPFLNGKIVLGFDNVLRVSGRIIRSFEGQ